MTGVPIATPAALDAHHEAVRAAAASRETVAPSESAAHDHAASQAAEVMAQCTAPPGMSEHDQACAAGYPG